ncbi:MAG: FG-GAP-like repeat-containing protein [Phycisphaerales bacterium]
MRGHFDRFVVVMVAGVLSASSASAATTYYVRKTGSDSKSGTSPANAFKTIDKAADTAHAGDTIYVGAGTYVETITPNNDGTSGSPITFIADTTGTQTGDAGTVTIQKSGTSGNALLIQNDDYITFRGFVIEGGSDTIKWDNSDGGVLENCTIRNADDDMIEVANGSDLTITSCTLTDSNDDGVVVSGGDATLVACNIDQMNDRAISITSSGSTVSVRRCTIWNSGYGVRTTYGTATIVNCVFYDIDSDAVRGENSSVLHVYACTMDDIGSDGVQSYGTANVYDNIMTHIGDDGMDKESGTFNASHNLIWSYADSRSEGFDSTEYSFDPGYVDRSARDYRLSAGSGAIDIGQSISSMTSVDRLNGPRPTGSGWDLGAYEYGAAVVYAPIPYTTDFESGAGAEWTNGTTTSNATLTQFAGRYWKTSSDSLLPTLHVSGTPGEVYYLFFDLYVIDSWDGDNTSWGPDRVYVDINGSRLFDYSFSNIDGYPADNPYSPSAQGNFGFSGSWPESVYRRIYIQFTPLTSQTVIAFSTSNMQGIDDESFGIDNVMVLDEDDAQAYLPIFTDVSEDTGFDLANSADIQRASGLHWADLDGDGDMDVIITGESSRVLRYDANSDTFSAATIGGGGLWRAGAFVDADGDGDLDFWAGCDNSYYVESLYTNTWPGAMSYAGGAGVSDPSNNEGLSAFDIDNDGWTDIVMFSENGNWVLRNTRESPARFEASDDPALGLNDSGSVGNGAFVSSGDVNNDGYVDFFYHYNKGVLLLSDGAGAYIRTTPSPQADTGNNEKTGSAWGDYDNDGDLDLYVPYRSGGGRLYRNDGGTFTNVASSAGITDTCEQSSSSWGDFDNDGDLDLLIATGDGDPVLLYENQGDGTFELVDKGAGVGGNAHDAVFVDYDSDGDLDIAITREDDTNVLLRNDTNTSAYLKVRVVRTVGAAIIEQVGVHVELWDQTMTTMLARRDIGVARGFGGSEPVWAHFGGVDPGLTYNVKVIWPGGDETVAEVMPGAAQTTFGSVTVPQMLTINGQTASLRVTRWREVKAISDD